MLNTLRIQDLAIVESVEIELDRGLNAITGETGAGKSILVGALELALGGRASADVVRSGRRVASVEAEFAPPLPGGAHAMIAGDFELEWDAAEPLVVRREVSAQGRSRCFVNGQMVNVADLRRLGELLVDLHGQHEHQSLFHRRAQRAALDAYGGYDKILNDYRRAHEAWSRLTARRDALQAQARDYEKRLDFLNYQIGELEEVAPREGEIDELQTEEARLGNAEALAQAAGRAYALLYEAEDEAERSALSTLGEAARALDEIARLDESMKELPAKIGEIEALVEDLSLALRDYAERCEADPQRLEEAIERLETLRRLMKKHGAENEAELLATFENLRAERDRMNLDERERNEIEAKVDDARRELEAKAEKLFEARREAAGRLARTVEKTLGRIGMEKAKFEVRVERTEEFASHGRDRVEFFLAANPGEGARPLKETASGGELSRTMLAIKAALARRDAIPTLVFDEIDAGIAGETAARVGRLMEELGASHQILCITHHAAIAARAGHHLSVRKQTEDGRTRGSTVKLGKQERVEELARMMGGEGAGAAGKKLARQLLEAK